MKKVFSKDYITSNRGCYSIEQVSNIPFIDDVISIIQLLEYLPTGDFNWFLFEHCKLDMSQKIKKGGKLSEVINAYPKLFTPIVAQMVAVGEETGELDNILVELAEFYGLPLHEYGRLQRFDDAA